MYKISTKEIQLHFICHSRASAVIKTTEWNPIEMMQILKCTRLHEILVYAVEANFVLNAFWLLVLESNYIDWKYCCIYYVHDIEFKIQFNKMEILKNSVFATTVIKLHQRKY